MAGKNPIGVSIGTRRGGKLSLRRQHPWMLSNLGPVALLWSGVLSLPAFLLQGGLVVRIVQVVWFLVLTRLAGKRLQWVYFLSLLAAVTVFHLLTPNGRVLLELGPVVVTSGALRTGFFKGLTIIGMVFISLYSVRADLRLPGKFGRLVARIFWAFEQIMEQRPRVGRHNAVAAIDQALTELYDDLVRLDAPGGVQAAATENAAGGTTGKGFVVLTISVGAQWVLLGLWYLEVL